ncbi:MAG: histidine--tRNA ligase [Candidatus Doudnabacteria bacterium]
MKLIEPRNLKGFRDYLPIDQIPRSIMFSKIKAVFERFGFEPLETPVLEYEDVLAGKYGTEGEKLMYRFKDNGERNVAMRYDLTVPLARVSAQYQNDLPKPFKRYQIAPVWRAENTQKGRYREFYQCDVDVVGAPAGVADAECIAMVEQIFLDLGIKKFVVKVNNRKILNAIMLTAGVSEDKMLDAIRAIDKLDKVGAKGVVSELKEKVGLTTNEAEGLITLASTKVPDIGALKAFINKYILKQPQGQEGFDELNSVFAALKAFGIKNVEIDLSLARGLDYYTSTIFETIITETIDSRKYGSVAGGGRYDGLIKLFTGKDVPAVGISIGIDRLFAAMEDLGLVKKQGIVSVLVLNMEESLQKEYLKIVTDLRKAGINSELYYVSAEMKKQFAFAEAKNIPYGILLGLEEVNKGTVTLRDLKTRKQKVVKQKDLLKELKKVLK